MHYKEYNAADIKFFPLLGETDNDGDPLEPKEQYKVPRSAGWKSVPVWSGEQIDLMEQTGQLDTGFGVLCDGLLIVDVDARSGGIASLERLLEVVPEIQDAGLQVATGSGGGSMHYYFKAPEGVALSAKLNGYEGIDIKSGKGAFVVGAGSKHASGGYYTIVEGSPDNIEDAPASLVDLIRKPEYHRTSHNGGTMDVSAKDLADMVSFVDPDCDHETWVRVGMAIHDASQGTAFDVWDAWSARGSKYPDTETLDKRWHSFGKSSMPVTIGTLIHYAEQGGWVQSVTFEADTEEFTATAPVSLLDTSSVDLLRPPEFAGELCQWVNDQCLYPREHLAVMVTLVALGNVCGLRYTDDLDGVTTNLFGFGVADSGSGKESTYGAFNEIMRKTGIVAAMHGAQKSEQELVKNLMRHQCCYYSIDEFGIQLQKIINAKGGSATYLEGLIGIMMSAYSKSNSFLPVSGDVKENAKAELRKEISQHQKAIENNEDRTGQHATKLAGAMRMLSQMDNGIERPFLSVMGMTTPTTFDTIVTPDQATSGFIGRAIIVRELNPNPERKYPFKKRPMPDNMAMSLQALAFGGEYNPDQERIEYYGDRVEVKTTDDACEAMTEVYQAFWDMAEQQKEATGLTAIPRRGYEMVAKISLILAAPSGIRTLDHIRWAYALVRRDVDEKLRLVVSNDTTYGTDRVLMSKITNVISEDHGETIGVIKNKLRSYKPEDVVKALEIMETRLLAKREKIKHKSNGKVVERWFYIGG